MQFVYCGKDAHLELGNVKPIGDMPEGSIICNIERVRLLLKFKNYDEKITD